MARKTICKPLVKEISQVKPRIGQGRAGWRWKKPQASQLIAQLVQHSQKILELPQIHTEVINIPNFATPVQSISNSSTEAINIRTKNNAENK